MSNKFQNFKTKLKENRKFQIQFVSVVTACVVVLVCAITIPVAVHTSNVKKTMTEEVETSANDTVPTEESTSAEATTETITEETTTNETTTVEAPKPADSGSPANSGSSSSNKGGSSGSPNNRPNTTTTKPVTTTKKETTTEDDRWNWTQADVDSAVSKARQYAKSKGYTIDTSLTEVGTSWDNPVDTRVDAKTRGVGNLKYQIDRLYAADIAEWGQIDSRFTLNIFSKNCGGYWEIYVVY